MENYIQLKKRDIVKYGIKDENGVPKKDENGNEVCLEFDIEDINTLENYSKCIYLLKKAQSTLQGKIQIAKKMQEVPGKGAMSNKDEAITSALKEYYKNCEEGFDMLLGQGGVTKIFGKARYIEMFDDLAEMLKPIMEDIKKSATVLDDRIKEKYSVNNDGVLKDE